MKTLLQNVTAASRKEHTGVMKNKVWGKQNMQYK